MMECCCVWGFLGWRFCWVWGVLLTSTYTRSTVFYLLETSGRLKLPSAHHLAGEGSKIFPGQTLSYIVFQ